MVQSPAAPRRSGSPRAHRWLATGIAVAASAAFAMPAHAQTTLNFNSLTDVDGSGVRYVNNCYVESGFRVAVAGLACGTEAALATWTSADPLFYTGSPALFNNLGETVEITATSGASFSLMSLGMAPVLGGFGAPTTVTFMGMLAAGGTVSQTFTVPGATTAMTAFTLTGFTGLSSVRFTVTSPSAEPYVQFDNVMLMAGTTAVIPEPSTYALIGAGLLGVAGMARTRRRRA